MYTKPQLLAIQTLIDDLRNSADNTGCGEDLTVINESPLNALEAEIERLLNDEPKLAVCLHEHRHGTSAYLFILNREVEFGDQHFIGWLAEDFEKELGESVIVDTDPMLVDLVSGRDGPSTTSDTPEVAS